jgi:hypothetical protein
MLDFRGTVALVITNAAVHGIAAEGSRKSEEVAAESSLTPFGPSLC